jgi:hypothetical protein
MSEYSQPGAGRIEVHGNGFGAPTPEKVEQRAKEIAMIDDRNPEEFSDADWDQAKRELLGASIPEAPEETSANASLQDEWEVVANDSGHRVPRTGVEGDEAVGEQLVNGGVEEATHDQMLEARREELEQEGRDT